MQLRTIIVTGMCALLPLSGVRAQDTEHRPLQVFTRAPAGWLGFGYSGGWGREQIVVDTVIPGSPAGRAGMQKSDTLTAINGLRASRQLLGSLGLQPGDEVEVTVRRAGGERTLELVAAERPEEFAAGDSGWGVTLDPEQIINAVRVQLDSLPRISIQTFPDSNGGMVMIRRHGEKVDTMRLQRPGFIWADSATFIGDSLWSPSARFFHDSLRVSLDSVFVRLGRPGMNFRFSSDSVLVIDGDTIELPDVHAFGDGYSFSVPRIARVGFSSVAGMELEELSERLGEYFGADHGLLVLEVADQTPAARAGLQDGDVILEANGEEVRTIAELRRTLSRNRDDFVRLQILREQQELTRTLQIERDRNRP